MCLPEVYLRISWFQMALSESEITRILLEELSDTSEIEDNLEVEDVGEDSDSEVEDIKIDTIEENHLQSILDTSNEVPDTVVAPSDLVPVPDPGPSTLPSDPIIKIPGRTIMGKSSRNRTSFKWCTQPPRSTHRTPARNVVYIRQGPKDDGMHATSVLESFSLFITDDIISVIVSNTNKEIERKAANFKVAKATICPTSTEEIKALIGLLILSGALKNNHLNTEKIFNEKYCSSLFRSTMSERRFCFLLRCLRFDDKTTRDTRRSNDRFAHIREIWDQFIAKCREVYKPGSFLTIDEQLVGFRGRCPFKMYIPNKPDKYGIKIVLICDVKTKYMIDADPYLGKNTSTGGQPLSEFYVKKLSKTVMGSNRNITCDNWFTSVSLAQDLLKEPFKLTLVGTIRSNKPEIPSKFIAKDNSRLVGTSMFCFSKYLTLVSFKSKKTKIVSLLSTMHEQPEINCRTKKPEIIETYNATKGGVDSLDQMCKNYSCKRRTARWPLIIFYDMLDISGTNSFVIYTHNASKHKRKVYTRCDYLIELAEELIKPWMQCRLQIASLPKSLRAKIIGDLGTENEPEPSVSGTPGKRTTCSMCPAKKRRMTENYCVKCAKPFCKEHRALICTQCN